VPVLTGWNGDDGVSFGTPQKADVFIENAMKQYGDLEKEFIALFPAGNDEEAAKSQKRVSQMFFGWQNYTWAKAQDETGTANAYLYYFTRVPPGEPNYGAFHSAEFGYALKTLKLWNRPFTDYDYKLSDIMSSYWVNFATDGDPNGEELPEWPVFISSDPEVMLLGDEVKAIPLPNAEQLKFFDKINN
jgi:para-nitrobenzyl esterase